MVHRIAARAGIKRPRVGDKGPAAGFQNRIHDGTNEQGPDKGRVASFTEVNLDRGKSFFPEDSLQPGGAAQGVDFGQKAVIESCAQTR